MYVTSDHNQGELNQFLFLEEDGNRKYPLVRDEELTSSFSCMPGAVLNSHVIIQLNIHTSKVLGSHYSSSFNS